MRRKRTRRTVPLQSKRPARRPGSPPEFPAALIEFGDDWMKRQFQVELAFREMSPAERLANITWLAAKYGADSKPKRAR